jgi:RimJ/RimL family protein N-acetyltransferase
MELQLKETKELVTNHERESWLNDPQINEYVMLRDAGSISGEENGSSLTNFNRYYEIFNNDEHVGDIKVFYDTEDDIFNKRAQILMVVGERNQGIGTQALELLFDRLKDNYNSVYCIIQRSNVASLKILKRNNFQIESLSNYTIRLSRNL